MIVVTALTLKILFSYKLNVQEYIRSFNRHIFSNKKIMYKPPCETWANILLL